MSRRAWVAILLCSAIGSGCTTTTRSSRGGAPGSVAPLHVSGRPVIVYPMHIGAQSDQIPLTPSELTQLFLDALRDEGIDARDVGVSTRGPHYVLECAAPQLDVAMRGRYPRRALHEAALGCALIDPATQTVVWQREMHGRYECLTLVNTMTKLPVSQAPVLVQECLVPVWRGMAYGVKLFLNRPDMARTQGPRVAAIHASGVETAVFHDDEEWRK